MQIIFLFLIVLAMLQEVRGQSSRLPAINNLSDNGTGNKKRNLRADLPPKATLLKNNQEGTDIRNAFYNFISTKHWQEFLNIRQNFNLGKVDVREIHSLAKKAMQDPSLAFSNRPITYDLFVIFLSDYQASRISLPTRIFEVVDILELTQEQIKYEPQNSERWLILNEMEKNCEEMIGMIEKVRPNLWFEKQWQIDFKKYDDTLKQLYQNLKQLDYNLPLQ